MLMITHQKALAENCAQRIMEMDKGILHCNASGEVNANLLGPQATVLNTFLPVSCTWGRLLPPTLMKRP